MKETRSESLSFPKTFRQRRIATNGTKLHTRVGGSGSAVVLLHGYGETGDMWGPLARALEGDHTIVAPDLRGMDSPTSRRAATTRNAGRRHCRRTGRA